MTENDAALLKRMATDLATVASAAKTLTDTIPPLAARVAALEATHGTNVAADTTEIATILSAIEGAAPAVAAVADSTAATAQVAAGGEQAPDQQAPAEQASAA